MHVYSLNKLAAGHVLSMFAVALMVGSPLLSWMANRAGRKPVLLGCSLLLVTVCGIFYLFTGQLSLPMLYGLYFCLCFAGPASGPVVVTASKELFPLAIAGTSVGMVNLFPFFGGAILQVVVGAVLSAGGLEDGGYSLAGYRNMFLIYLLGAAISLIASILLQETLTRTLIEPKAN
jgi:MFS family permease